MASPALTAFNTFVDSLGLDATRTSRLKTLGEKFYVAIVKEEALHVRKHLLAAVADGFDPLVAAKYDAIIQRVLDTDERQTLLLAEYLGA